MGASLPISLYKTRKCGQCHEFCPRIHYTRQCWVGVGKLVVVHLCSRKCVKSLETTRCHGCRTLGLRLQKVSPGRYYCLAGTGHPQSCFALVMGPRDYDRSLSATSEGETMSSNMSSGMSSSGTG